MTPEEYKINKTIYEEKCEELEVYRKALEMACDILGDMDDSNSNSEEWNEWLLQKAREEE